jgi:hypothetical protein
MGLNTSHGCWDGAYSAFMRWRQEIAKHVGIPLMFMEGFYSERNISNLPEYMRIGLPLRWDLFGDDAIFKLLYHSDCEGEIESKDCAPIADRLEEILKSVPEELDLHGHVGNFHEKTRTFITGLRRAAEAGQNVEFH